MKICKKCKSEKELSHFGKLYEGYRPRCKECDKEGRDKYNVRLNRMAFGLVERLKKSDEAKNKCYKGIKCLIGSNAKEIKEYINKNFEEEIREFMKKGVVPSIDRIDSSKHYEDGNIQIISFEENSAKGLKKANEIQSKSIRVIYPNGEEVEFKSISEASRVLRVKRDTIIQKIKDGTKISGNRVGNKKILGVKFCPVR